MLSRKVVEDFGAGDVSSDGGGLLLRAEQKSAAAAYDRTLMQSAQRTQEILGGSVRAFQELRYRTLDS